MTAIKCSKCGKYTVFRTIKRKRLEAMICSSCGASLYAFPDTGKTGKYKIPQRRARRKRKKKRFF